jgi:small-conductance mechanosensitive channel
MLTIAQADAQQKAQMAQQEREFQMAQQQALLQTQAQAVAMQEATKRMNDQLDAMEAQRDRLAKWYTDMTKTQADLRKAGVSIEVPGGLLGESDDEMGALVQ